MNEVYEFLKKCGTYYLATVEGDQPRVRPFGTVDLFEGKLYIQTGADGTWLRVAGSLIRDDRIEAKKHMLEQYPSLQAMYSAEDDNTEVLYFRDATATFASFGGAPRTVTF